MITTTTNTRINFNYTKKAHNHLIQNSVVNLSDTPLSKPTTNLLSKGLEFIPSPNPTHYNTVYQSFLNYRHNMHTKYFFRKNIPMKHPFKTTSIFTPPQPDNSNLMEYISLVYHDLKQNTLNTTITIETCLPLTSTPSMNLKPTMI